MFALYRNKSDGTRPIRIEPVSLIVSSQVAGVENTAVDSGETIESSFTLLVCVCVCVCVFVCMRACFRGCGCVAYIYIIRIVCSIYLC